MRSRPARIESVSFGNGNHCEPWRARFSLPLTRVCLDPLGTSHGLWVERYESLRSERRGCPAQANGAPRTGCLRRVARDPMAEKGTTKKVGRLIRSARMHRGLTQKDLAKKLGVRSGSYVGMLESGLCKGIGIGRLEEIASFLHVNGVERYRWLAAAGHLPPPLFGALIKSPELWDEVVQMLGGPLRSRIRKKARGLRAS